MSGEAAGAVEVVTFGCRLNLVESDAMRGLAVAAGQADLTIVNTCAVTAEASRQARQAIRRLKRERPGRAIAVTGCASDIEAAAYSRMPEVDRIVPNGLKTMAGTWRRPGHQDRTPAAPAAGHAASPETGHTRGFLEIQNGCDHRCTFCVIPFGRGASRSVPVAALVAKARDLVDAGMREIVLTGVDLTSYGGDLGGRPTLGKLVQTLLGALPALPRLRLSSIDCVEADPTLLVALRDEERLMPHLHLSLQSGSDLILKRMKRRHTRADAVTFCREARRLRPDIVFGADFITGFPTETDDHFADTLKMVEDCGLTHLHVFPYSPRPNTPAARMPQVPRDIAKTRAAQLRGLGDAAAAHHRQRQLGRRLTLLMERGGKGRAADFTILRVDAPVQAGDVLDVVVTAIEDGALIGSPVIDPLPNP